MSLSEERLDEIRDSLGRELGMWTNDSQAAADLLAEVERLRAGIEEGLRNSDEYGVSRLRLRALLNPTEGGSDE